MSSNNRSFKNLLLDPLVQIKLGLYSILLAFVFAGTIFFILKTNLNSFSEIVMTLTDAEEEVKSLFQAYMNETWLWVILASLGFVITNIAISIIYTHKLVGPSIAFQRQIKALIAGEYNKRVKLRDGDCFNEIAESLNELAKSLEQKNQNKAK